MLRFSKLICGAAILLAAAPAFAQPGGGAGGGRRAGGGGGGRGGAQNRAMVELVSNAALQTELGATEEQKTKLTTLSEAVTAKRQELGQGVAFPMGVQELPEAERAKAMADFQAAQAKITKQLDTDFKTQLNAAIDATQQKRLQQVYIQFLGVPGALTHDEVVAALALDQAQKDKIKAEIDAYTAANPGFGGGRAGGGGGGGGAGAEAATARDTKILAVLTDAQKKKYEELKGTAFDVTQLRGGRGGRGGGAGGGGGGGRRGAGGA